MRAAVLPRRIINQSRTSLVGTGRIPLAEQVQADRILDPNQCERKVGMQTLHAKRIALSGDSHRPACVRSTGLGGTALSNLPVRLGEAATELVVACGTSCPLGRRP